ncbi:hypothetical protein ABZ816_40360 [Actinosynnema sp. NPDC047251]|uniref:Putative secreted protein n=1 Tax=Saccharothrix espanaensis (strain ATCC 51144 / DSM 44229 / JCM 9112 / NBRC 15066 / NRRL 15764) TaxID=1179773 RepID=K0K6G8_SACES|nr:hypothetical protein [Saccharothrix espanaensis]CCH32148.1 putative secreted protein [Saccharothrix espanaensis DSM 44229]
MRGLVRWFEGHVLRVGLIGLIEAALAVLSFGAVLSAVFGGPAAKTAAVVVAVLGVLATFAALVANRRRGEADRLRDRRLTARYCDLVHHAIGAPLHYLSWDDVTVIDSRGDAVETIAVRARVEADQAHFFRFRIGPAWDQPERQRTRVVCRVRTLVGGAARGPRCDTTETWLADGRLEVIAHLASPVKVGDELRLVIDLEWPGMCAPLVREREPDDYFLRFARPADEARYVIVLPEGEDTYAEPIGFADGDRGYDLTVKPNDSGRVQVTLTAYDIPARHRFGVRLDLK